MSHKKSQSLLTKAFEEITRKWVEAVDAVLLSGKLSVEEIKKNCKEVEYENSIWNDSMDEEIILREVLYGDVVIARMARKGYRYSIWTGYNI